MADYISRDSVLELTMVFDTYLGNAVHAVPVTAIRNIPSADVAEARHGKWRTVDIFSEKGYGERYYQHKECSTELYKSPYNFCPHCGADMRKDGGQ